MPLDDVRDVGQAQASARVLERHLAELGRSSQPVEDVADLKPLLRRFDEAPGSGG